MKLVCVDIVGCMEVTLPCYPQGEGQGIIRALLIEANNLQTICGEKSEESSPSSQTIINGKDGLEL